MTPPTCSTCAHFSRYLDASGVGTCALGGPEPGDGCSDVGEHETCPLYLHFTMAETKEPAS